MKKLLLLPLLFVAQFISAQNLDEIVKKHIEAIGGLDNWNKIKNIKLDGVMKQGGSDIYIHIYQVDKVATRQEIEAAGMKGYSIITTTEGWSFMPFQGQTKPEPMTADDVKNSQDDLNIKDEFITYKELGKKLELLGKEDMEGIECFKIKMTDKDGQETTYFIDTDSYHVIKQVVKTVSNGKEYTNEIMYSNFEKLPEGIVYPMAINSGWGTTEVTKIEINTVIDESLFKPSK